MDTVGDFAAKEDEQLQLGQSIQSNGGCNKTVLHLNLAQPKALHVCVVSLQFLIA